MRVYAAVCGRGLGCGRAGCRVAIAIGLVFIRSGFEAILTLIEARRSSLLTKLTNSYLDFSAQQYFTPKTQSSTPSTPQTSHAGSIVAVTPSTTP